jgi:catechol 2,3-dioxygenase-like lactoylglutathione lyase family enzyme
MSCTTKILPDDSAAGWTALQSPFDMVEGASQRKRGRRHDNGISRAVPIFRIYSLENAREFYIDFLGFKVDWEHRFTPDSPVLVQISRQGIAFFLSEHHGDGTPGSIAYVYMNGVRDLHRELNDKTYRHMRPGLHEQEWGMTELGVIDPFNNRITFGEPADKAAP